MRARASDVLLGLCVLAAAASPYLLLLVMGQYPSGPQSPPIAQNELAGAVKDGRISSIEISDDRGLARGTDGQQYWFQVNPATSELRTLGAFGVSADDLARVDYVVKPPPPWRAWVGGLASLFPLVLLGLIWLCSAPPSSDPSNELLGLIRHRARLATRGPGRTRFEHVAGVEEAKQDLEEVVEFLTTPEKFLTVGARIPKGVLLVGPPGTGKTLLARAVAGEACVPFFSISGSEFVEVIVGVGAGRVRDLFAQARRSAPCIVFVDEIDAIGRRRGSGVGFVNEEREQTLNQILVEMDGFDSDTNVIVIAATNRPDVLDPALLRPGRFDRQVVLPSPDVEGRQAILRVHASGKPFDQSVDLGVLARVTSGFSGADLANLLNEGAILAARGDKKAIGMFELEEAVERVIAGAERTTRVMSAAELRRTAYHEGGHAVAMHFLEHHDPVHRVTIVARGRLNGFTRSLASEDRSFLTRTQFEAMLAATLAGHAAEQVVFGEVSAGIDNDLQVATGIARQMVTNYGMSDRLGTVALGRKAGLIVLGRALGEQRNYSDKTAEAIDAEVRRLMGDAYAKAIAIVRAHRDVLNRVTAALIEKETLEGDELGRVLGAPL
jgi:cell division protease FtsH